MSDYKIMKAVEYAKLPAAFRKFYSEDSFEANGYWLQKKYDGCMGIAKIGVNSQVMESRTGEDYSASCGHILRELRDALTDRWGSESSAVIIGEVWEPISDAAFPEISGKFRRHSPSPCLKFIVNDLLPIDMSGTKPYHERHLAVTKLLGTEVYPSSSRGWKCFPAETHKGGEWNDAKAHALRWQGEGGYDGAILRDPNSKYTIGLVKAGEIIKVKPLMSLDLEVVRVNTAVGEKTGRPVYTLTVIHNGVESDVGSGVPHEVTPGDFLRHPVEIECLGVTAEGKLREPRFKGLRFDKLQPDA